MNNTRVGVSQLNQLEKDGGLTLGGVGNAEPRPVPEGNSIVIAGSGMNVGVGVNNDGGVSDAGVAADVADVALGGTGDGAFSAGLGLD